MTLVQLFLNINYFLIFTFLFLLGFIILVHLVTIIIRFFSSKNWFKSRDLLSINYLLFYRTYDIINIRKEWLLQQTLRGRPPKSIPINIAMLNCAEVMILNTKPNRVRTTTYQPITDQLGEVIEGALSGVVVSKHTEQSDIYR